MPAAGITRQSLVTGPAMLTFKSQNLYSKADAIVRLNQETLEIDTSALGKVDERVIDVDAEIDFTPDGRIEASSNDVLWPYASTRIGASLFGSTDSPCTLNGNDGEIHSLTAAAVVKMPSLYLSASKTAIGPVTIRGVRANGSKWSDANSLYTLTASGGSITDTDFAANKIKVQPYVGVWGSVSGFTTVQTEDGWTIDFNMTLSPRKVDAWGAIDYIFQKLDVMAKCVPIGPTSTQLLTALKIQGTGAARGRSLNDDGSGSGITPNLVITGDDGTTVCTLFGAALKTAGYRFGATVLRNNEVGFVATRLFTAGVPQPLFAIAPA